ncbi:MAG: HupE/UreJ family protein [Alphaproteobacteria bacterium]|nr:HupE/UreJ family protein [Alphaproteobacteria bacterium]MBV9251200.1 HupE/UreJ family protein [Acetobacteraceae bacterium]MBV9376485.1 HupE/UreJ family protein [Alphaproteobacteria bacterium]
MRRLWIQLNLLALLLLPATNILAHEVRPSFLELRETAPNFYLMTWKVPALGDYRLGITPHLPDSCRVINQPVWTQAGGAFVEHAQVGCDRTLEGQVLAVDRLDATLTDVLVRIETADGLVRSARLTPTSTSFVVPAQPGPMMVIRAYTGLGVEHILFGVDHLLFVLCLMFLVHEIRKLLATVTAFTLAHSITLAAATLGFVRVPAAPVEATIALSIVFLARELSRGESLRSAVTQSYPWLVAFSFGLLHGLGFAGALAEVGLPQREIPLALFAFNIGVELGQLAFIIAVLLLVRAFRFLPLRMPSWSPVAAGYVIGTVAAFWVFARLSVAA